MAYISSITTPDGTSYQLKPSTTSLTGVNLNTITGTGFYDVLNCTNSRYTQATMTVTAYSASYCSQMQTDLNTGEISVRVLKNGTWGSWNDITTFATLVQKGTNGNYTLTLGTAEYYLDADSEDF